MNKTLASIALLLATMPLFACGGGGGGNDTPATTVRTKAVVKLFTQGTLTAGTNIGGIDVVLNLPTGVSVKTVAQTHETDPVAVVASGIAQNSFLVGNYSAPTATAPANVHLVLVNGTGFGTGEFATVNCDIAAGNNPAQTDFSLSNLSIIDASNNPTAISGLTAGLTAAFQ
jgi:hypothetical protein